MKQYYDRFCNICNGYRLAFPENLDELEEWLQGEDEYGDW